jgi:hypothetical protein
MKKFLTVALILLFLASILFIGCGKKQEEQQSETTEQPSTEQAQPAPAETTMQAPDTTMMQQGADTTMQQSDTMQTEMQGGN